jgi:hypothetical protein
MIHDRNRTPAVRAARARQALIWAAVLTIVLYFIPFGNYVLYPLTLFSTFTHEVGHGLAAVAVGNEFVSFRMWADGSGIAQHRGFTSPLKQAAISTGGLAGPAIVAAALFLIGRRAGFARTALYVFAAGCVLAEVLVVRNTFGIIYVAALGLLCFGVAHKADPTINQVFVVFLAIQLSLSAFSRSDYLFMQYAQTAGGRLPSDTMQIALALGGPYWLWGALVGLLSVTILVCGLWSFLRATR